jgi:endonuclease YncB( thermonuclease family)
LVQNSLREKSLSALLLILILAACSASEQETAGAAITYQPIIITPVRLLLSQPVNTSTQEPEKTNYPVKATANPASMTPPPAVEPTPANVAECLPENTLRQDAFVTEVIDGDTIIVRLEDGNTYPVRFIGIDAPERNMQFFAVTFQANAEMVDQKEVILIKDVSETDPYDRLLRYVVVNDVFVNLQLIETGFARAMQYPPDIACAETFFLAEQAAQSAQSGLWIATATPKPGDPLVIITEVNKQEEYVVIQNVGASDVDLAGWMLVSERGNQECNLLGVIGAGDIWKIWSGSGQGDGFSCGYNKPIWNNSETDPAVLYNAQGIEVNRK